MGEKLTTTLGCAFALLMIGLGFVQVWAGFLGIQHSFGSGWAIGAVVAALLFRFTLPLVVGVFLCAYNVWDWHWFWAAIFAAPGLLFMIPAIIAGIAESVKR